MYISNIVQLSVDQIYKWGYERKNLLKKTKAQKKVKKNNKENKKPEINVTPKTILDFNQEVEDLCHFDTGVSTDLFDSTQNEIFHPSTEEVKKFAKVNGSFMSKDSFPPTQEKETQVEDDPFFYNVKDDDFFYVSNTDNENQRPHRRVGKRGLFRIPSGFFNLDFYTYKEESFQNDKTEFLAELYKKE